MAEATLFRYRSGLFVLAAVWLFLTGLYGSALTFAALQDIGHCYVPFKSGPILVWTKSGPAAFAVGFVRYAIIVGLFLHALRALREYGRHFVLEGSELRKYDAAGNELGRVDLTQAELPGDLRGELTGAGWRLALGTILYTGGHHIIDRRGGAVTVATRYLRDVGQFHEGVRRAVGVEGQS
jgi:hypothetical protein